MNYYSVEYLMKELNRTNETVSRKAQEIRELNEKLEEYKRSNVILLEENQKKTEEIYKYKLNMEKLTKQNNQLISTMSRADSRVEILKYEAELDKYKKNLSQVQQYLNEKENIIQKLEEENMKLKEKFNKTQNLSKKNKESKGQNILNIDDLNKSVRSRGDENDMNEPNRQKINIEKDVKTKKRAKSSSKYNLNVLKRIPNPNKKDKNLSPKKTNINKEETKQMIKSLIEKISDIEKKFSFIKKESNEYFNNIKNQDKYINNYKEYIKEVNERINSFKDELNISVIGEEAINKNQEKRNKVKDFSLSLNSILLKVEQFKSIVEECRFDKIKKIETLVTLIQNKIDDSQKQKNNEDKIEVKDILKNNYDIITNKLKELENKIVLIKTDKLSYENKKKEIEGEVNKLKDKMKKFVIELENEQKQSIIENGKNEPLNDSLFLKGSILLDIDDFGELEEKFKKDIQQNKLNEKAIQKPDIIKKSWNEICYVYNDYNIHDIHFELFAVGLSKNTFFSSSTMGFFSMDHNIEIEKFKLDDKDSEYKFDNYTIEFKIRMKNYDSKKVHIIYKETPKLNKLSEQEQILRKFFRDECFGIGKIAGCQIGKYILKVKSDFEVISFKDDIFVKNSKNEKEYIWEGKIPPEGMYTNVLLSKAKARWTFSLKESFKLEENKNEIKDTTLTSPVCFVGGNNTILKIEHKSPQTENYSIDIKERAYIIKYRNVKSNNAEFIIRGTLENKCKGIWNVDLTDEQIEANIPKDFIENKEKFNELANNIIKKYDETNKNKKIKIHDCAKIGKWIKENIKYDLTYLGKNEITASEILKNKTGVCHHFTQLYNALLYSLGYKVIYCYGFALEKKDTFDEEEAHAWSLIKINNKWIPFDSTWGIFSGKLPVCHVFQGFFSKPTKFLSSDKIIPGKTEIYGKYIEKN